MGCINSKSAMSNKAAFHTMSSRIDIKNLPSRFDYAVKKKGEDDKEIYLDDITYKGKDEIL